MSEHFQRTWDLGKSENESNDEHPGKKNTVRTDVKDPDIRRVGRKRSNDMWYKDAYSHLFERIIHLFGQGFDALCSKGLKYM